jgi:hypothetical protein
VGRQWSPAVSRWWYRPPYTHLAPAHSGS